jgi:acyl-CoA thioester hydrolase
MGHMNVRFYLAHALEGLAGIASALGMPDAFSPRATSTLEVREHHIRFVAEARSGSPIHVEAGIIEIGGDEAVILQVMRHSRSGEPCAALSARVAHTTIDGRPFPWSTHALEAAKPLACALPAFAAPKGVDGGPVETRASRERAQASGLRPSGRGIVTAEDCDVFGRLRDDAIMGRLSDAAAQIFGGPRRVASAEGGPRVGGALLEIRMLHHRPVRAGAHLDLRSGLAAVAPKSTRIVHWLFDGLTGEPLVTAQGVAASFDLDARKIYERSPEQLARLDPLIVKDASF